MLTAAAQTLIAKAMERQRRKAKGLKYKGRGFKDNGKGVYGLGARQWNNFWRNADISGPRFRFKWAPPPGQARKWATFHTMNSWKKNSGFKQLWTGDCFTQALHGREWWLVPLADATRNQTNPVYNVNPEDPEPQFKLLRDLSESKDHNGVKAVHFEYLSADKRTFFWCARVELKAGLKGWINVAKWNVFWPMKKWVMYMKPVRIDDKWPMSKKLKAMHGV